MTRIRSSLFDPTLRWASLLVLSALGAGLTGCTTPPEEEEEVVVTCEDDDEAGQCLESVRLTYLNVRYDLSEPVYVNNRVPVEFGVTATSPEGVENATRQVAVSFAFVEADPANPDEPVECGSNALNLELIGDGEEQVFSGFIWPTTVCEDLAGRPANLRVDFDANDIRDEITGIDYPSVVFRAEDAGEELNQQCRKTADPYAADPGYGCVYELDMQPTPRDGDETLIDVRYAGFTPATSVGVLPPVEPGPRLAPSFVTQSVLVVDGRDPYIAAVDPEDVPDSLEADAPGITDDLQFGTTEEDRDRFTAMPDRAILRFEVAPIGGDEFLPLTVADEAGDRVDEVLIEDLLPGTPNAFTHELFIEGDTREAFEAEWSELSDFTVRGCFEAAFPQQGNRGAGEQPDCRTFEAVLVRDDGVSSAAESFAFNHEFSREVGTGRIKVGTTLTSVNTLDRTGASSLIEGAVSLNGKLGKSFSLELASAHGQATLGVEAGTSGYEVGVNAFGESILTFENQTDELTRDEEFTAAKAFSFPGLGFGFGPIRLGFKFEVGGQVGFGTTDTMGLSSDPVTCQDMVGTTETLDLCGAISRTVTPGFAFTAAIEGGIDIRIVKAGIRAELSLMNTDFPLTATLGWGLTPTNDMVVLGNANWQLELTLIKGQIAIVGRVGFRRWSRSLRVNIASFSSPTNTYTLLDESMDFGALLD